MRKSFAPALLLAASTAAFAENPPDTDALEARIAALEAQAQAMREQTAQVLAALDAARAEIAQLKSAPVASAPPAAPPPSAASSADSSGNAFNPAISVILDGQYAHHSLDGDAYARSGFPLVGEGEPSPDGLSLGESELSLAANVDDKFYGQLTLAAETEDGADSVGIEEAFIDTTALPAGWSLRAGRFFSNIGYLNSHHTHTDKFPDRPLAYQAFLGNQYGDDGVQLLRYRCPAGYQPVDADVAGDRLFVLERRISLLRGWQSRIVAVPLDALDGPEATVIAGEELAVVSGGLLGENYEGLSVEATSEGGFRLLIVADDNFNELQRTKLLELAWQP